MLRTNNFIDTCELKKTLEHHSITDNVADKALGQIDATLDAINNFMSELDNLMVDLEEEGCTLAERRAVYLGISETFKRSVGSKYEAVSKGI